MDGNLWKTYPKPLPLVFQTDLPQMSNNLTKRQIVQSIYEGANYNHKDVTEIVQKTLDHICEGLIAGQMWNFETLGYLNCRLENQELVVIPTNPKRMWSSRAERWSSLRQVKE